MHANIPAMVDLAMGISTTGWLLLAVAWWMNPRDWRTVLIGIVCLTMSIEMPWIAKLGAANGGTAADLVIGWAMPWIILAIRVLWILHRRHKQQA